MQREVDLADGEGGNFGNYGGKFTGGGGNDDEYGGDMTKNHKRVTADEKYSAYGRIAREFILHNGHLVKGKPSFMEEIREIQTMRGILEGP